MGNDQREGSDELPPYARMMADYHAAFHDELRGVVAALGLEPGSLAIDVACGDGSYAKWLAEAVGPRGRVVAVDVSAPFLELARGALQEASLLDRVDLVRLNLDHSPLAEGSADLVWCAQSLYSLPDPVDAVRRLSRAAKPNGRIAVFESDELHHIALPWPIEVELAVRRAEWRAFKHEEPEEPRRFYIARDLPRVFREAGLPRCDVRSFAFSRRAPFDRRLRGFLEAYLKNLWDRAEPHLDADFRDRVREAIDPASPSCILDDPDALVVCFDHLAVSPRS